MAYGRSVETESLGLTILDAYHNYKTIKLAHMSRLTAESYEPKLDSLIDYIGADIPLNAVTELTLDLYVSSLFDPRPLNPKNRFSGGKIGHYSKTTIKNHIRVIKAFFSWCRKKRYIDRNPAEVLEPPPIPAHGIKPIPEEHLLKLLSVSKQRDYLVIYLLSHTGLRISELCGLRTDGIDYGNRVFHVVGKGNKFRYVPFDKKARQLLSEFKTASEHLFTILPNGIRLMLKRRSKDADVPYYHPHQFRHYFATKMLSAGCSVGWLQLVLGHEIGSRATDIYVHSDIFGIVREYDRLTA